MPELDAMNPEMDPQQTAGTPDGGTDREGAMAKADLYKLANYSHKLFQQMHDDDQLEAWVQAKITKAADYIASVYHYLEYEMKFSEYGHHLDNSDTLSEGQKMKLKEVLAEAKMKMKDLKKTQAEKIKEEKSSTGGEITRSKGVTKHKENPNRYSDEEHGEVASNVKSQSAAEKREKAPAQQFSPKKNKTWGMRNGEPFDNRDKELEENMEPCEHCGGAGHVPKAPVQVHPAHAKKVGDYAKFKNAVKAIAGDKNGDGVVDAKDKAMAEGTNSIMDIVTPALHDNRSLDGHIRNLYDYIDRNNMENDPKWKQAEQMASDYYSDWSKKNGYPSANTNPELARKGEKLRHQALVNAVVKVFGHHVSSLKGSIKSAHGTHTEPNLPEGAKPSAGLSKAKKSAVVKDAKAGKDLGKPGKSFDKVAKSAGGGEKGKKIAAAAMWKNIKETTAYVAEKAEVEKKAKRDYDEDGKIETGKAEHAGSVDKAIKASKAKETVKESADMTRLRELTKHLLG